MTFISCEKDPFEPLTRVNGEKEMDTYRANATVSFKERFNNTIVSISLFKRSTGLGQMS